jgi:hypothetical protein
MKGRKNPYLKLLKQSVTIRLDRDTVEYFKTLAEKTGVPYQSLINLYLRDCAANRRRPSFDGWLRVAQQPPEPRNVGSQLQSALVARKPNP